MSEPIAKFPMAALFLTNEIINLREKEKEFLQKLGDEGQPGYALRKQALENVRNWIVEFGAAVKVLESQ